MSHRWEQAAQPVRAGLVPDSERMAEVERYVNA